MKIDNELLHKLEKLSALEIATEKQNETIEQLSEIVSFVEILNELELDSIQGTASVIEVATPFRQDEIKSSQVIDAVFAHAPSCQDGFFIVPKIIE
ncbi:Asp-tRNA(Asn)/Glu-tRNA(Gln) amidotransferase subunit GatC [Campylobacter sp. MIT 97-5078]|uniref:Asp-tRNA(Asn)/Glu-tRNA(Gln) amidotransferase subunit GatC n=1 Tax=Campylobacter sp. MIT 97-5078 TaxID=1548153 RepID=UPI00051313A4|nr:Asp-tRNA(Asn)/Glu-tRNA(Gln) amidotransferase subunit GatC [Campylobacter sp. MIT 97-5078]KGI56719.1 glutamyl-tRNA amidotransferase [Campylobacter sp. MIT 97-5078]KGI57190.1 glutamyl-tRNA amidotransferase [Campylobacter sp. MIT 97-5078]TQR27674.1 Asp-tRNA(Asn)/Glu-tRNA(Gln) amidotransferase subunit GatC [Campylobacter sp. MIT 97-5078]